MSIQTVCLTTWRRYGCAPRLVRLVVIASALISLSMTSLARISDAAILYLKPDTGLDSNPGTLAQPWKTIDKIKSSTNPGDTVNIVGGTYTRSQYKVGGTGYLSWGPADRKGTAGSPITIQANPGDTVVFDGGQDYYFILFYAASPVDYYVVIQNLEFKNYRSAAFSVYSDPTVTGNYAAMYPGYVTFQNNYMHNYYDGGTGEFSTQWAHHVLIRNNRIEDIGLPHPTAGFNGTGDHGIYIAEGSQFVVAADNRIGHVAGYGIHLWGHFKWTSQPMTPKTKNVIVRKNTIWNTHDAGVIVAGAQYENVYVAHNTVYQDPTPFPEINFVACCSDPTNNATAHLTTHNQGNYVNMVWVNNLSYGTVFQASSYVDLTSNFTGPQRIDYNLWGNLTNANAVFKWDGSSYNLPGFQGAYSNAYDAHSLVANPLFTNTSTRDFTLQTSSPAIDRGTTLTATTAPCSATSVTVADAGFFHDGYGMVTGDIIQIGASIRTLSAVIYNTNTLVWTGAAVSCSTGTPVTLPYNGSAPDLGAAEIVPSGTVATQLAYTTPPVSTTTNTFLAPIVVEVRKSDGSRDTSSTAPVTLTLSGGPGFLPGTSASVTQTVVTPKTGRYVKLVTLADANNSNSASLAEISIFNAATGLPIPQAGMNVVSVSSEETSACCGGPHLATQSLDNNTSTYWFTRYTGGTIGHPYTLILDLGASYSVNGWTYLPHQVAGAPEGHVTQYQLYVSTDGTTWGTAITDALLTGTMTVNAVAGVATFSTLKFGTQALTYQLTASSPGLAPTSSMAFAITQASGRTFYLKPDTGLDTNDGLAPAQGAGSNGPWKTMFKVKSSVTAGDTVNVVGGTYTATQYKGEAGTPLWLHTHGLGTSNNPIIIQTNPGDTQAVFDGEYNLYWMVFRANASYGGHYIVVRNLTFHHYNGAAIGFGMDGSAQAHHFAVINCIFQNFRSAQTGALVQNTADNAIYRNNRFFNIGDNTLGGDAFPEEEHAIKLAYNTHNVVVDGNWVEKISGTGIRGYGSGLGSGSGNWIVRRNTVVNTWLYSMLYAQDTYSNIYTYHNTLYNEQIPFPSLGANANCANSQSHCANLTTHGGANAYTNMVLVNNVSQGYDTQAEVWVDSPATYPFAPMDYNLWYNSLTLASVYRWNNTFYDLPGFRSATPGTQEDHAKNALPLFTNAATRDFTLQALSPARNTGMFLTTAVGAGTASTALTVGDAKYFTDGYGISASIVPGDTIQVGSVTTTITSISGNVLTVSPAISWSSGANVSLPYTESAPDMGAYEVNPAFLILPATIAGVDFDGIDDYLDMSNTAVYQGTNASFSVTGYFQSMNDEGYIFAKRTLGGTAGGYFLRINNTGSATARIVDSSNGTSAEAITTATTYKDGQWHCFVAVYTTNTTTFAGNQVTLFVDDVQTGPVAGTVSNYNPTSAKFVIGALSDLDASGWFNGSVDNLRWWNGAFTAAQAQRLCASKLHYFSMPMASVSYWPMDNCAEGASAGGVSFPDRMKGGSAAVGVIGGTGTGLTCHGSNRLNYPGSVD